MILIALSHGATVWQQGSTLVIALALALPAPATEERLQVVIQLLVIVVFTNRLGRYRSLR